MPDALYRTEKTIFNVAILTMNPQFDVIGNGYITILGNTITAIGAGIPNTLKNAIDGQRKIIIPGLINAHTHLPMTLYRGIADDLPLKEWLENHIWPAEKQHTHEENVRKGARLGLTEMIKTGTTTFCDMYFFADAVAEETEKAGLRAVMNEAILDFPTNSYKNVDEALTKAERFINRWKEHPLINSGVSFHSAYACSKQTLMKVKQLAHNNNLLLTTHVAETTEEESRIEAQYGMNTTQLLYDLGLLNRNFLAAHCVHITSEDQKLFQQAGAHIVHCPTSNLKLGSGVAPIPTFLKNDINVALGTDGCASNNNLDMVEEMRLAALLHKGVNHNPTLLPAREVLKMATLNGAKALGLDSIIGSLEVGKRADLLLIETQSTFMNPLYDYYSAIVYSMNSSCIDTVLVDGRVLMENKKLIKFL